MDAMTTLFTPVDMAELFVAQGEVSRIRQVYVSSVDYTNEVATIMFGGSGGTAIPDTPYLQSYYPVAGDTAWAVQTGTDIFLIGSNSGTCRTQWIPTLTATTTNPTLGTGAYANGYIQIKDGRLKGEIAVVFGTSGTNRGAGAYTMSLPVPLVNMGYNVTVAKGFYYDADVAGFFLAAGYVTSGSSFNLIHANATTTATAPFTWASGGNTADQIIFTLDYPVV